MHFRLNCLAVVRVFVSKRRLSVSSSSQRIFKRMTPLRRDLSWLAWHVLPAIFCSQKSIYGRRRRLLRILKVSAAGAPFWLRRAICQMIARRTLTRCRKSCVYAVIPTLWTML